ncbi:MAG: hypothetical protein SGJ20_14320, partial [Planctomycetota bacterium]|nr:hypothetical protein [Planctomycetota bacterium]
MASSPLSQPYGQRANGWRGRLSERFRVLRHRWQQTDSEPALAGAASQDSWRRVRVLALLGLFAGLLAMLVYYLMHKPVQTPLIAISTPPYAWPLPPNSFTAEDLQKLTTLDKENSIQLANLSASWSSSERGLRALDRQLDELVNAGNRSGVVVLYLSAHGVVDGEGRPCLILPSSNPWKSETWLPVSELLARIKAHQPADAWHKLLVLDCNRMEINWDIGLLYNSFADGLEKVVQAADVPNLAVLNSAGPGQRAWDSTSLQATVFGHYLQLGLAGAADSWDEDGNRDRQVSLHELHRYLLRHVDRWAQHNRDAHQRPMLIPATADDFSIVWTLNSRTQARLVSEAAKTNVKPFVQDESVAKLWRKHDEFSREQPLRLDPLSWSQFEHKLSWLNATLAAGNDYKGTATAVYADLKAKAAAMEERSTAIQTTGGEFAKANIFATRPWKRPAGLEFHSLSLAALFGQFSNNEQAGLRMLLDRFVESPSRAMADEVLAQIPLQRETVQLSEPHLLRLMQRDLTELAWQKPALLSTAMRIHRTGNELTAPSDERVLTWIAPLLEKADRLRRRANDALFVGDESNLLLAETEQQAALKAYADVATLTQKVTEAYRTRDEAWG